MRYLLPTPSVDTPFETAREASDGGSFDSKDEGEYGVSYCSDDSAEYNEFSEDEEEEDDDDDTFQDGELPSGLDSRVVCRLLFAAVCGHDVGVGVFFGRLAMPPLPPTPTPPRSHFVCFAADPLSCRYYAVVLLFGVSVVVPCVVGGGGSTWRVAVTYCCLTLWSLSTW